MVLRALYFAFQQVRGTFFQMDECIEVYCGGCMYLNARRIDTRYWITPDGDTSSILADKNVQLPYQQ